MFAPFFIGRDLGIGRVTKVSQAYFKGSVADYNRRTMLAVVCLLTKR